MRTEREVQSDLWREGSADLHADTALWHAEDGSATELEVSQMIGGLVRGLQPDICVEAGCYKGQTSYFVGEALHHNGHGTLYALDSNPAMPPVAAAACAGLPVQVLCTDARSWEPPGPVDFVFVDTGDPRDRYADITHWLKFLSPRGVMVCHDSGTQFGLRPHLLRMEQEGLIKLMLLPTPRGLAIVRNPPSAL